jgi:hypothetical protein
MKLSTICFLLPLLVLAPTAYAQEFYVCSETDGSRVYKSEREDVRGCKRVDLQGIQMIPSPYKRVEPIKPTAREWPQLAIGMSKGSVVKVWGKPSATHRVQTREFVTEEWKYAGHAKLVFQNGVLEVIED